jgi:outer membrane protein assembly factor BamB
MMKRIALAIVALALHACGGDDVVTENITSRPAPLVAFEPTAAVKLVWSAQLNPDTKRRGFSLAPVVHDGKVFSTEATGRVAAYDAASGALRWEKVFEATISSGAGAAQGVVALGLENGELVALDAATGAEKFRAPLSSELLSAPQIAAGKIVVCTSDGKVSAFDAGAGNRIWSAANIIPALTLRGSGRPVVVGERVVVGFPNGHVAAFNLQNGKRLWETTVAVAKGRSEIERLVDIDATPRVFDGVVYAAAYQGQIAAVALDSGQTLWTRDASTYVDIAVDQARIYLAGADGQVWALDRGTGASLWRQEQLRGRLLSAPVVVGALLAVGDFQGYLHWLNAADGHFAARESMRDANRRATVSGAVFLPDDYPTYPDPAPIRATPWAGDDRLFVRDENGILAAYQAGS